MQTWLSSCKRCHVPTVDPMLLSNEETFCAFLSWSFDPSRTWDNSVSHWSFNLFESKVVHWLHSCVDFFLFGVIISFKKTFADMIHVWRGNWSEKRALLLKCLDETRVDLQTFYFSIFVLLKIVLFWTHFTIVLLWLHDLWIITNFL